MRAVRSCQHSAAGYRPLLGRARSAGCTVGAIGSCQAAPRECVADPSRRPSAAFRPIAVRSGPSGEVMAAEMRLGGFARSFRLVRTIWGSTRRGRGAGDTSNQTKRVGADAPTALPMQLVSRRRQTVGVRRRVLRWRGESHNRSDDLGRRTPYCGWGRTARSVSGAGRLDPTTSSARWSPSGRTTRLGPEPRRPCRRRRTGCRSRSRADSGSGCSSSSPGSCR